MSDSAPSSDPISIIVPTFQEAENLRLLVGRVFAALQSAGLEGELIFVDDASDDGTEAIVEELARTHPIRVIVRRGERGLSSAVLRGFEQAKHDLLVVMDADLSHPPERIPGLVQPIRDGSADFVIGSRYVAGGKTIDWTLPRRINSLAATLLARPLVRVRDPMAGFFALHRRTWEGAAALNPVGYKIGLELLIKGRCRRVVEIPIEFSDRLHGRSKLTIRQQWLYLVHLARLYRFKYPVGSWLVPLAAVLGVGAGVWWLVWR